MTRRPADSRTRPGREGAPRAEGATTGDRLQLTGLTLAEWDERVGILVQMLGERPYRVRMIRDWVFRRAARDCLGMSDLPRSFRERLEERAIVHPLDLAREERSRDGTRKFLWRRAQGDAIESVYIPDGKRRTFCISTQAGCPVRCTFCATGYGGFSGQLTSGEIIDQVLQASDRVGAPPTNLVFMGMGEPLLNAEQVFRAITILCQPEQVGLGARRLTLSTVGVPRKIVELAERHPQVKLAVSLHAPRDELRNEIIPLNRQYPLRELLGAVRRHHEITTKLVTFEYVLLPGVNDRSQDARELGRILRGIPSRINLIGFNPFPGAPYRKPAVPSILKFRERLARAYPGAITVRRSRGEDIQGACGQLSLASHAGPDRRAARPARAR